MEDNNTYLSGVISWGEIDRKLYFKSGFYHPGTFYYDLDENRVFLIAEDEKINEWQNFAYGEAISFQNKVIFIPYNSEHIGIYNTITGHMSYKKKKYSEKYYYGLRYNHSIIMIPYETEHANRIMVYDPINDITRYPFENDKFDVAIKGYGCVKERSLYLPIKGQKQLLKIELPNNYIEYIDVNAGDLVIDSISFINDSLYIAGNQPYIIKWERMNRYKKIIIAQADRIDSSGELALTGKSIYFDNSLIYIQSYRGSVCRLDLKNEKITEKKVVRINTGDTIGFQNACEDFLYFELDKKNGRGNIPYLIDKHWNVRKLEAFVLEEKMDLSKYTGVIPEYSKYAIQHYLNRIIGRK